MWTCGMRCCFGWHPFWRRKRILWKAFKLLSTTLIQSPIKSALSLSSIYMTSLMLPQCSLNCKHLSISDADEVRHCPQNCQDRESLSQGFVLWFYFISLYYYWCFQNQFYSSWFTSISQSSFLLQPYSMARLHSKRTRGAIPTPLYFSLSLSLTHTHTYFSQIYLLFLTVIAIAQGKERHFE